uniref:CCHC-type domain-containing protein n=1 Tax=Pelusios castaneus TaxID=367368 RepID=A0A8C8S355_9SAUR
MDLEQFVKWLADHQQQQQAAQLQQQQQLLQTLVVKGAILDVLDITPETFRRRFRGKAYNSGVQPRALAQELKEACRRWLQPKRHSKEELMDTFMLEQFLHSQGRRWVIRYHPANLNEAVSRLEDFLAAESPGNVVSPKPERQDPGVPGPSQAPRNNPSRRARTPGRSCPQIQTASGTPEALRTLMLSKESQPQEVPTQSQGDPSRRGPCFRCGQMGHLQRQCTTLDCSFMSVYAGEG